MAKEKIYGNLEYCYNGLPIIRGYCSYKKLLQYSIPHPSYQRVAEEQHVNEIREYLESPQIKFMPEVVLSFDCTTVDFNDQYLSLDDAILKNVGTKFYSSNKDLSITHIGKATINKIVRFEFNEGQPAFLQRIDGNHRLEALKDYRGDDFQIPFCIILLSSSGNPELRDREKTEMEIFHNINAKVKPLTSIEQINGLFNLFSVDELLQFGKEFSITQEYLKTYSKTPLFHLSELFSTLSDAVLRCVKFLIINSIETSAKELADIFCELDHTYFTDYEQIQHWQYRNPTVTAAVRKFVHRGGGFIGVGEPTGHQYQGHYLQLAGILGVEKETGFTLNYDKYNWEEHPDHFILADVAGEADFGEGKKSIYALEGTDILVQKDKEVQMAVNAFGNGRSLYISDLPYSFENSRVLYRAILWSAHSEDILHKWFSTNYNVEVHAFVANGKYCVVNNTYVPQDTTVYTDSGSFPLHLEANEIRWYNL